MILHDWRVQSYKQYMLHNIKTKQLNTEYSKVYYIDKDTELHFVKLPKNVKNNRHYR